MLGALIISKIPNAIPKCDSEGFCLPTSIEFRIVVFERVSTSTTSSKPAVPESQAIISHAESVPSSSIPCTVQLDAVSDVAFGTEHAAEHAISSRLVCMSCEAVCRDCTVSGTVLYKGILCKNWLREL